MSVPAFKRTAAPVEPNGNHPGLVATGYVCLQDVSDHEGLVWSGI